MEGKGATLLSFLPLVAWAPPPGAPSPLVWIAGALGFLLSARALSGSGFASDAPHLAVGLGLIPVAVVGVVSLVVKGRR